MIIVLKGERNRSACLQKVHRMPQSPEFSGRTLRTVRTVYFSVLNPLSGRELWPS